MKNTTATLSGIILVCLFLPWIQIETTTILSIHGGGHSIDPTKIYMDMSFIKILLELGVGSLKSLWVAPGLVLGGLIYSLVDRKNGYSWLSLHASTIALLISGSFWLLVTQNPEILSRSHTFIVSEGKLQPGMTVTLIASLILWIISVLNNAKHYKKYKKTAIAHAIISICIFVASLFIFMVSNYFVHEKTIEIIATIFGLISFVSLFLIAIFLSAIVILILAVTLYKQENHEYGATITVEEYKPRSAMETEPEPEVHERRPTNKIIIYCAAGVIGIFLIGWFIHSRNGNKAGSTGTTPHPTLEEPDNQFDKNNALFIDQLKGGRPDTYMRLNNGKLLFIKESEKDYQMEMRLYVNKDDVQNPRILRTIELEKYVYYNPTNDASIENIDGREYLYLESLVGTLIKKSFF